jgi:hypothetical protein
MAVGDLAKHFQDTGTRFTSPTIADDQFSIPDLQFRTLRKHHRSWFPIFFSLHPSALAPSVYPWFENELSG